MFGFHNGKSDIYLKIMVFLFFIYSITEKDGQQKVQQTQFLKNLRIDNNGKPTDPSIADKQ